MINKINKEKTNKLDLYFLIDKDNEEKPPYLLNDFEFKNFKNFENMKIIKINNEKSLIECVKEHDFKVTLFDNYEYDICTDKNTIISLLSDFSFDYYTYKINQDIKNNNYNKEKKYKLNFDNYKTVFTKINGTDLFIHANDNGHMNVEKNCIFHYMNEKEYKDIKLKSIKYIYNKLQTDNQKYSLYNINKSHIDKIKQIYLEMSSEFLKQQIKNVDYGFSL